MAADPKTYLKDLSEQLQEQWPNNKTRHIICHGHSVPSGYFATPVVNTFEAYPHLLHTLLKQRFPTAVMNVIVTAIGGENSLQGSARFKDDVLCHKPDLLTIDYALNDRGLSLPDAEHAWRSMIEAALNYPCKVLLLTPTWDRSYYEKNNEWNKLVQHAEQVRRLADEYGVALVDSFLLYDEQVKNGVDLETLLSHVNHPSAQGHFMIAKAISAWFGE